MPFSSFDNPITSSGYVSPEMEEIWSVRRSVRAWYQVEAALAQAQAEAGMIPAAAAEQIAAAVEPSDEVIGAISAGAPGNPFTRGLDALRGSLPAEASRWVHYGATTQDIMDTARALQIRESLDAIQAQLREVDAALTECAHQYADTVMVARTNGQFALPTTLGYRFARWTASVRRSIARIDEVRPRATMAQFSGAVGTYASMGEHGSSVARGVAERLGLPFEEVAWHAERDSIAELCTTLAIAGQTLAKIAEDLFDMQRSDFAEASEEMDVHFSGSSTMPQKRNPFDTMKISVAARVAAGSAATVLTQPPSSLERDHRALEVDRDAVPRICAAVHGGCVKLRKLIDALRFDDERLHRNATAEGVLTVTEGIMMAFAARIGHERAHDVVQEFAGEHRRSGTGLEEFVAGREDLKAELDGIDLAAIQRPESYTGQAERIARGI